MEEIYLDYNASSPSPINFLKTGDSLFGNPNSIHSKGREAVAAFDSGVHSIARFLNCRASQILITSGASESNSWVFHNFAIKALQAKRVPHFLISSIEHESIYLSATEISKQFGGSVDFIPVSSLGCIDLSVLRSLLEKKRYDLVSVMFANNETGVIQPISEASKICETYKTPFHTDAVQALGRETINFADKDLGGVCFASFSGHKIGALKGVGVLYSKDGVNSLSPMIYGTQQNFRRGGTQNALAVNSMGLVLEHIHSNYKASMAKLKQWHGEFEAKVKELFPEAIIIGENQNRLSNTSLISIPGIQSEKLVMSLDMQGVYASSGSACHSGSIDPSRVLIEMRLPQEVIDGAVRYSSGYFTKKEHFEKVLQILPQVVERIRFNKKNFSNII